ncbi:MAG: four helix bundle protein [Planctomycetota bacterium]
MATLKAAVAAFIAARDWQQFHAPKNIAMSIAIEAAELMEHFQWLTTAESAEVVNDPATMRQVRHELADVAGYVLDMANVLDIDLAEAVVEKLALNAQKYPVALCRGSAVKYTELHNKGRKVGRSESRKAGWSEECKAGMTEGRRRYKYTDISKPERALPRISEKPGAYADQPVPQRFEDLWIWKSARVLLQQAYKDFGKGTPGYDDWDFRNHMRKTALSIQNNIAEGYARRGDPDFARFLSIAKGSCGELQSMYYTAEDLSYITAKVAAERRNTAGQLSAGIHGFIKYLRNA